MKKNRVVITGMGVVSPNALGLEEFHEALYHGKSGIKHWKQSKDLNFRCQLGGVPQLTDSYLSRYLPPLYIKKINNKGTLYACLAGLEAWQDADLKIDANKSISNAGIVFGSGALGLDSSLSDSIDKVHNGESRKLGSTTIPQYMNSGATAYLNQIIGFGYKALSNSSACITGSESVLMGYNEVASGNAEVMLCGSTEGDGKFIWAGFDAMRVLCPDSNNNPEFGSRPMSESSNGFIPSGGSGALVLESLDSAKARGAKIYAEVLGGAQNCGGLRNGGTMTAPNSDALIKCIKLALSNAEIEPSEVDLISGHLTSTKADSLEIRNWTKGLNLHGDDFPLINTPKSMIGHCIAGAGSIESVASVLQIHNDFIHKNINLTEDTIHSDIKELIHPSKIPLESKAQTVNTVIKSNFGFGDLNCVLVFRKFI